MNPNDKTQQLRDVAQAIQQRWGPQALRTLRALPAEVPHLSTQFPALDHALGIGGLPRGRITQLQGRPTSGMSTLALKAVASAQRAGDMAVYIDPGLTFDPDYAARCGVDVTKVLLVHPASYEQGLAIGRDLVASGGAGLLVVGAALDTLGNTPHALIASGVFDRLNSVVGRSPCVLIVLTLLVNTDRDTFVGDALAHYASVRLHIVKERWLRRQRDVRGYRARVKILKNKLATPGRPVTLTIGFSQVIRGDGA